MAYTLTTLDNGFRIATERNAAEHSAAFAIAVDVGARYEEAHEGGLSHLLEHMAFKGTATMNAREIAEDYVEAIADLITLTGEARVVDLARTLGVTHVTVSRTITRLQRQGFVRSEPYRSIFLTESGAALARDCKSRHETVTAFLRALGVRRETAERDAEGIEHHVSDETLAAFLKFLNSH
jgi:DtxR family manganese transport transcriptional regulator